MTDNNVTINPENVTTGGPVEGACCYTSFDPDVILPDTASENIAGDDSGFENLGELSDQGWTISTSTTNNKFKGYHGTNLLTENAGEDVTLKLEFVEICRPTVNKLRFGADKVTVTGGMVTAIDPTTLPGTIVPIVIDTLFSNGIVERTVFPRCKVESVDDEGHVKGGLRVYGMTFTALVDENGRPYYKRYARLADVSADTTLAALTVGTLRLTPLFNRFATSYEASTTSSSVAVTAIASDEEATIAIKNGSTTVTNGSNASLSSGANTITVTVTNGEATKTYTVVVTKS